MFIVNLWGKDLLMEILNRFFIIVKCVMCFFVGFNCVSVFLFIISGSFREFFRVFIFYFNFWMFIVYVGFEFKVV